MTAALLRRVIQPWRFRGASRMTTIRMRAMLKRLDVDTLELAYAKLGAVYAGAREQCRQCSSKQTCTLWLDEEAGERPDFCPNLETFARFLMPD